jgi:hypothetical protein
MKQTYTQLVMVSVKVTVEYNEAEGFYYATVPTLNDVRYTRVSTMTMRSADKETAISEALRTAGYGVPSDKSA